jgi:hypothetical protein
MASLNSAKPTGTNYLGGPGPVDYSTSWTVSFALLIESSSGTAHLLAFNSISDNQRGLLLYTDRISSNASNLTVQVCSGVATPTLVAAIPTVGLTVGAWYNILVTHDATARTVRLYVNEASRGSIAYAAGQLRAYTPGVLVGRTGQAGNSYRVDCLAIRNVPTSATADIRALSRSRTYTQLQAAGVSGLVYCADLDESSTGTAPVTRGEQVAARNLVDTGNVPSAAGQPDWTPAAFLRAGFPRTGHWSRKTVVLVMETAAGAATSISSVAVTPTVTVNGSAATVTNAVRHGAALQLVLAAPLAPGDVATVSAPVSWAITPSGDGGVGVVVPVSPPPLAPLTEAGEVGGFMYDQLVPPQMPFNDVMKGAGVWTCPAGDVVESADGYIASGTGPFTCQVAYSPARSASSPVDGLPNIAEGTYTLTWKGTASVSVSAGFGTTASPTGSGTLADGLTHYKTYAISYLVPGSNWAGRLSVAATTAAFSELHLWRPGVPVDGSAAEFAPEFLAQYQGAKVIRSLDTHYINGSSIAVASDWRAEGSLSYAKIRPGQYNRVVRVDPYTDPTGTLNPAYCLMKFTTLDPHGLTTGQVPVISATATVASNKGPIAISPSYPIVLVLDDHSFAFEFLTLDSTWVPTAGQTFAGSIQLKLDVFPGMPPESFARLCAAVGAGEWWNVPHAVTDACAASMFGRMAAARNAAGVPAGRTFRIEYTNEHFNGKLPFWQYWYMEEAGRAINHASPGTFTAGKEKDEYYVYRAGQLAEFARAAWASAGRDPAEVRLVLGSQGASGAAAMTTDVCNAALKFGIDAEEVCIAPYFNGGPVTDPQWTSIADLDVLGDGSELWLRYGDSVYTGQVALHVAALRAKFPAGNVVVYETSSNGPFGVSVPNYAQITQNCNKHPAAYYWTLEALRQFNDLGLPLVMNFECGGAPSGDAFGLGIQSGAPWQDFNTWNGVPGKGDGSDGRNDNRVDFTRIDLAVYPRAQARNDWNALLPAPPPPPPPPPPPATGGRMAGYSLPYGFLKHSPA